MYMYTCACMNVCERVALTNSSLSRTRSPICFTNPTSASQTNQTCF